MEKTKLFGDVYDVISCIGLMAAGIVLIFLSSAYGKRGFLYAGLLLVAVFGGLLLFSLYARYRNRFTELKPNLKTVMLFILSFFFGLVIFSVVIYLLLYH